jgi:cob(I)alamin adenosyltransferase
MATGSGDDGMTSLRGNTRVRKDDARVEAYGAVDETSAVIGVVRAGAPAEEIDSVLALVQSQLFTLCAELATPAGQPADPENRIEAADIARLDLQIQALQRRLPRLKSFLLPARTPIAALLHQARAVCRRAERRVLTASGPCGFRREPLVYLNRLGDLLFLLARRSGCLAGLAEEEWSRRPPR